MAHIRKKIGFHIRRFFNFFICPVNEIFIVCDIGQFVHYAFEIGVDPEEYVNAAQKVKILTEEEINNATEFLNIFFTDPYHDDIGNIAY